MKLPALPVNDDCDFIGGIAVVYEAQVKEGVDMKKHLLATCFLVGTTSIQAQPPQFQVPQLPEGEGKQLVELVCYSCHSAFNIVTSAGYDTAEEWKHVFSAMVNLSDAQAETIGRYLAESFPADQSRRPTLVPGNTEIRFREWIVPTLGQRARDPVEAPDGSIWWTGMWASLVGRLDPQTGDMQEYRLPLAARPHSIVPDEEGNIWYTGNSNGTIGMLDPETGLIKEFPTQARDPHSAAFHPNGKLYFTAQGAGMLGRLDPETGELTEVPSEPRPYGIQVGSNGTLWVAFNGTNKIGAMDPETMNIRYFEIPNEASRVRRLGLDSQGMVWFVNSTQGKIGRLNPATGSIRQWDSPSGPTSHPYALAVVDDKVWYNESGMRPDTLVRFDPDTEGFQSWEIPSGVGIIRNMWVTREGNLLIHQSSSNRVGLVEIPH
jgi:virginiamycin B lyase